MLPVVDYEVQLRFAGGNQSLASELLHMLMAEFPRCQRCLRDALAQRNPERLSEEVHCLAGGAAFCGAIALKAACDNFRSAVLAGDWERAITLEARLEQEMQRLLKFEVTG